MGIMFPIGMFIYAWSTLPQVPWIALVIGMTVCLFTLPSLCGEFKVWILQVFVWAAFTMYLAAFNYIADWSVIKIALPIVAYWSNSYGPFASSASAGQSLLRGSNITKIQLPNLWPSVDTRKSVFHGLPTVHWSDVCRSHLQMGKYSFCSDCCYHDPHSICKIWIWRFPCSPDLRLRILDLVLLWTSYPGA